MKRLSAVVIVVAVAATALAAWGLAAPSKPDAAPAGAIAKKKKLPPLPAAVRQRKQWIVGVKCDTPPFGYIDTNGRNAGYDVEIARWFARFAFGKASKVKFECVTTASRIPALDAKRVDIIIATISWFPDRAQQITFSLPYYAETGRLSRPASSRPRSSPSRAPPLPCWPSRTGAPTRSCTTRASCPTTCFAIRMCV